MALSANEPYLCRYCHKTHLWSLSAQQALHFIVMCVCTSPSGTGSILIPWINTALTGFAGADRKIYPDFFNFFFFFLFPQLLPGTLVSNESSSSWLCSVAFQSVIINHSLRCGEHFVNSVVGGSWEKGKWQVKKNINSFLGKNTEENLFSLHLPQKMQTQQCLTEMLSLGYSLEHPIPVDSQQAGWQLAGISWADPFGLAG